MTEIAIRQPTAVTPAGIDFTAEQIDTIKRTIAKGASDTELDLFLAICRRTGLDPFLKQIHLIPRRSQSNGQWVTSYQPMVGIDGMRLTAERTGKYGGFDGPEWLDSDGVWTEVWTGKGGHPIAARFTVYRKDWQRSAPAVARWDSYAQDTAVWKKMPDVMLAKCAESLAMRRAFPAEMSQLAVSMGGDFDGTVLEIEASENFQEPKAMEIREVRGLDTRNDDFEADLQGDPNDRDYIDPDEIPFDSPSDDEEESARALASMTEGQRKAIEANSKALSWTQAQLEANVRERQNKELADLTEYEAGSVIEWQCSLLLAKGKNGVKAD